MVTNGPHCQRRRRYGKRRDAESEPRANDIRLSLRGGLPCCFSPCCCWLDWHKFASNERDDGAGRGAGDVAHSGSETEADARGRPARAGAGHRVVSAGARLATGAGRREPLVESPVAMAFDARAAVRRREPRLSDRPAEGRRPRSAGSRCSKTPTATAARKRTEFADGLTFPNGVMPWNGGLIVTCAPDVLYLSDTDGDGKADERRVLLHRLRDDGEHATARQPPDARDRQLDLPHQRADGRKGRVARRIPTGRRSSSAAPTSVPARHGDVWKRPTAGPSSG